MATFERLSTTNALKMEEDKKINKMKQTAALRKKAKGDDSQGLPDSPTIEAPSMPTAKSRTDPKKRVTKTEVKDFHKTMDEAELKKREKYRQTKLRILMRYHELLPEACRTMGRTVNVNMSEQEADAHLASIRQFLGSEGAQLMVDFMFVKGCDYLEQAIEILGVGKLTNRSYQGLGKAVEMTMAHERAYFEPELTELRCEWGDYLSSGLYFRLGMKVAQVAQGYADGVYEVKLKKAEEVASQPVKSETKKKKSKIYNK